MSSGPEDIRLDPNAEGPFVCVDDDPTDRRIVELAHENAELPVPLVLCKSGHEFLALCAKLADDGQPLPSLVMMDINMPGLNGIETVTRLREDARFSSVPVICMLSSSLDQIDVARAKEAGANAYRHKPAGFADFVAMLQELVG